MSDELRTTSPTFARHEHQPKHDASGPCYCLLPDGKTILTTTENCTAQGGTPTDGEMPRLIPYILPSGREVVGSHEDFLADGGRLVDVIELTETDRSDFRPTGRVLCRLPSGRGIVETIDECLADGGTVVGKIVRCRS
jgi:hypothetical protein